MKRKFYTFTTKIFGILALLFTMLGVFSACMGEKDIYVLELNKENNVLEYQSEFNFEEYFINSYIKIVSPSGEEGLVPLEKEMFSGEIDTSSVGPKVLTITYNSKDFLFTYWVKYRVDYIASGEIISTQLVSDKNELERPNPPDIEGYTFFEWEGENQTLDKNITINAVYKEDVVVPSLNRLSAEYSDKLESISLPSNKFGYWRFVESAQTALLEIGEHTKQVEFVLSNGKVFKEDSVTISVRKKLLQFTNVTTSFEYDGNIKVPEFSFAGVNSKDVNVEFICLTTLEAKDVGVYDYVLSIEDENYESDYYYGQFEITKKQVTIKISSAEMIYSEKVPSFTLSITDAFGNPINDALIEEIGAEIDVPVLSPNAGNYQIGLVQKEHKNFEVKVVEGTLTVTKALNEWQLRPSLDKESWTYGEASALLNAGKAKFGDIVAKYYSGETELEKMPANAGEYKVVISVNGNNNYNGLTKEILFTIEKKGVIAPSEIETTYNEKEQIFISETDYYAVENDRGTNAGDYVVTIKLKDALNYKWVNGDSENLTLTCKILIATNSWTLTPSLDKLSWIYGEDSAELSLGSAKFGDVVVKYYSGETELEKMPTNAGEYKVVISVNGNNNYNGLTKEILFTIEKKGVIAPSEIETTYNEKEQIFISETDYYAVENGIGTNTGDYVVTIKLKDALNYKWVNGDSENLTLTCKILIATNSWQTAPSLDKLSWTYGEASAEISLGSAKFGDVVAKYYSGDVELEKMPTNAGEYKVVFSVSGTDNYTAVEDVEIEFTIKKASIAEFSLEQEKISQITYNEESAFKLEHVVLSKGYSWADNSQELKIGKNAYSVIFTPEDTNNYNVENGEITLNVVKANAIITAQNAEFTYNEEESYTLTASLNHKETELEYQIYCGENEVEKIGDAGSYKVVITSAETAHYNKAEIEITVNILQIENQDEMPEIINATYLDTLGNFTDKLPLSANGTWTFKEGESALVGNAGEQTHAVVFTPKNSNYKSREAVVKFNVAKKSVEIPSAPATKTYTGNTLTADVSLNDNLYSVINNGGVNAGEYDVVLTLKDKTNYTWLNSDSEDKTLVFEITQATNSWQTAPSLDKLSWIYGEASALLNAGKAKFGDIVAKYYSGETELEKMPTNAGEYKVVISVNGNNNYNGLTKEILFTIEKKGVIAPSEIETTYNEKEQIFISETDYYAVENGRGTNAGDYVVTIKLKDALNYKWVNGDSENLTLTCKILIATNSWTLTPSLDKLSWTYGEESAEISVGSAKFGDIVVRYYSGETELEKMPTNAGEYKVVISVNGNNNYNGLTKEILFTIEKKGVETPSAPASKTYTGGILTADVSLNDNLYSVVNEGGINADDYLVVYTLRDSDNYKWSDGKDGGERTFTFTIERKGIEAPAEAETTYNKTEQVFVAETDYYTVENGSGTNAGDYVVTLKLKDNYAWLDGSILDKVLVFTIKKASVEIPSAQAKIYTGEELKADLESNDLYTVVKNDGHIDVGVYYVELKLVNSANYRWETSEQAEITIEFHIQLDEENYWVKTPSIEGWVYGENAKTPIAESKFGDVIIVYISLDGLYNNKLAPREVGKYKAVFSVNGTDNFNGLEEKEVSFEITKATNSWTLTPSLDKESWTYGEASAELSLGSAKFGDVVVKYYSGETELEKMPTNAGEYKVVFSVNGTENYTAVEDVEIEFTIAKASIAEFSLEQEKISQITYNEESTFKLEHVVLSKGYSWADNSQELKIGKNAYSVIFTPEDTNNYNVENGEITLNVVKANAIITAQNAEFTYNEEESYTLTASLNHKETELKYQIYCGENEVEKIGDAGSYKVIISSAETEHYNQAEIEITVTILQIENQDVMPEIINATYLDTLGNFTDKLPLSANGTWTFKEGESALVGNAGEQTHAVVFTPKNSNYKSREAVVKFNVAKKSVEVPSAPATKTYTGNTLTAEISETEYYTISENYGGVNAGEYDVVLKIKDNYKWKDTENEETVLTFTIEKKGVIAPSEIETTYNEKEQIFISETDYYAVENGRGTNAGDYVVTIKLKDALNYKWVNGDSENLTLTCKILIATNSWTLAPSLDKLSWTYGETSAEISLGSAKFGDVVVKYYSGETELEKMPTNAGEYKVVFSVNGTENYTAVENVEISFTINKASIAEFSLEQEKISQITYNEESAFKLEHVVLSKGYSWADNSQELKIGKNAYSVIFTPEDTNNYNVENGEITLNVVKANAIITAQNAEFTYNEEESYTLTASLNHKETELKYQIYCGENKVERLGDAGSYKVVITSAETEHYNKAEIEITVTILQIENQDEMPEIINATYLDTLGNFTDKLPLSANGTWTFKEGESALVGNAGEQTHAVVFTPKNSNYKSREAVVKFNVAKKSVEIPSAPATKTYTGNTLTADVSLNDNLYSVVNNGGINAGNYDVVLTLKDKTNYTWLNSDSQDITLVFEITQATNSWQTAPSLDKDSWFDLETSAVVNKGSAKFGDVDLQYYFGETLLGATMPTTSGEFKAVFSVSGTDNYTAVEDVEIEFTIKEAVAYIVGDNASKTYYVSIENALGIATSGNVWVVAGKTGIVIAEPCTIEAGVTLNIPHTDEKMNADGVATLNGNEYASKATINVLTIVTINERVTLTNKGALQIAGELSGGAGGHPYAGHTAGKSAKIVLKAGAKIENAGGTIKLFGLILEEKEETGDNQSQVIINGGNLYMPYVVRDFGGGTYMSKVYTKATAFNEFELRNITAKVTVKNGANVYGYANLYAGSQHNATTISLVSTSNSAIIHFIDSNGYLTAKYNIDGGYTGNDAWANGVLDLNIYGGATADPMALTVKYIFNVTVSTKDVFFPLSWRLKVSLFEGNYTMADKYKLMPGHVFTVGKGAILTIGTLIVYTENAFTAAGSSGSPAPDYKTGAGDARCIIEDGGKLVISLAVGGNVTQNSGGEFDFKKVTTIWVCNKCSTEFTEKPSSCPNGWFLDPHKTFTEVNKTPYTSVTSKEGIDSSGNVADIILELSVNGEKV